jgi:hypothetical protein
LTRRPEAWFYGHALFRTGASQVKRNVRKTPSAPRIEMKKFIYYCLLACIPLIKLYSIEPQRDYLKQIQFVDELGSNFKINTIGYVNNTNAEYPIYKITYNPESRNKEKWLILCGVHGNEPAPVYAIRAFLIEIDKQQIDINSPSVDFIYVVNPWGFVYNQRSNAIGIDINRDITSKHSQEAKILIESLSIRSYNRVFDFHEGNTKGYYLYYYSKKQLPTVKKIIDLFIENNLHLENEYKDIILEAKNGIIFVPSYAKLYMRLKNTLTTTLWAADNGINNSYTIETSKNRPIDERTDIIEKILEGIFRGSF